MPHAAAKEDLFDPTHLGNEATGALRTYLERIERLAEEKQAIADDIKEVYSEAKGGGFDVKQMRRLVAIRKMDREKWEAEQQVLDLYLHSLGLL